MIRALLAAIATVLLGCGAAFSQIQTGAPVPSPLGITSALGTWFAGPPGRNPHGRHGARVARTQSGGRCHNRNDREQHDVLGDAESVIGNIRLEHDLRRRRNGVGNGNVVARQCTNAGNLRHQLKQQCFIVGCNIAHLAGRCRPDRNSVGLRRDR